MYWTTNLNCKFTQVLLTAGLEICANKNIFSNFIETMFYQQQIIASFTMRVFFQSSTKNNILPKCLNAKVLTLGSSLFREEISVCAVVHTRYFMDACDRVQPIILLPPIMRTSFVLVALTRLIVSQPKHRVTWSHRTCINFPFLRGERIQYLSVSA